MEIPKKEGGIFFFSPGRSASVMGYDYHFYLLHYTVHSCRYIIIKHKPKDKTEEDSLISCKKESTAAVEPSRLLSFSSSLIRQRYLKNK